jgi:thermitase
VANLTELVITQGVSCAAASAPSPLESNSFRGARASFFAALLGLIVSLPAIANAAQPEGRNSGQWAKGRILVMPREGLPDDEFAKILKAHGGKARKIGQSRLHIVDLHPGASEQDVVEKLSRHPHLKFAELDRRVAPNFAPSDPYFGSEAHLARIGAPSAWDTAQGAGVTIAILDTGVDGTHPDLVSRIVPGYNFNDNNTDTSDVYGHGTATAGTAAAATDNATGVASVAGQARIMPIRISDPTGYAYYSTIAQGLTWAADHGARVANCSFDGVARSAAIQSSAQYMKSKGGLVTVAAGNNGIDENIPPTATMIPVSATDNNDAFASWSSRGSFVALSAPGTVWTTSRGGAYQQWQGTSFSSPIVAGVVALMMSAKPALDNTQVESLLYSTAVDLGTAGRDPYYGYGRVNALGAVQAVVVAAPAADTQAPAVAISSPADGSSMTGIVAVDVSASDNVGVARVELRVNGTTVAIDSSGPFGFSWDSSGVANGMSTLVAYAFDAAGNSTASAPVSVSVANGLPPLAKDTTPPVVSIANPVAGSVSGNVSISTNASDNNGAAGISQSLYIDGVLKATGTGATLGYNWNTRKIASGTHIIEVRAKDAAGNAASKSVQVTKR